MRNVWLVAKHEVRSTLGRRAFWIMTFVFPLVVMGLSFGGQFLTARFGQGADSAINLPGLPANRVEPVGCVDHSGLIKQTLPGPAGNLVIIYHTDADAENAMRLGEITKYYRIPADFLTSGDLLLVDKEYAPFKALEDRSAIDNLINYNLVGDPVVAALVRDPSPDQVDASAGQVGGNNLLTYVVPYATVFIMFFVLTLSSTYMLRSVTTEKETRMVEMLLVSIPPRDLMLGKILGLGSVALLQITIWATGGLTMLRRQVEAMAIDPSAFQLPAGFVWWVLAYFLFGYLMYGSILAALGAMAPTSRETNQFTFYVLLPLMVPLWLNSTFMQVPNGPLATFLSLFPLTSPVSMVTRMTSGVVPVWQPFAGLAILAVAAYGFVALGARFFQAGNLLSGAALNLKRIREAYGARG